MVTSLVFMAISQSLMLLKETQMQPWGGKVLHFEQRGRKVLFSYNATRVGAKGGLHFFPFLDINQL